MNKLFSVKKLITFIITILFFGLQASSQVWSEPKNISNDSYSDYFPDICIDNNGVLHCVLVKLFETNYFAIYYSKSTNQGYSWYPAIKISPYTSGVAHEPSINCDSLNNLYVIYKYDINQPYQENYYFTKFNGQNWSTPVTICDEYPGAFQDEVVMDEHDRLYIFWHGTEHKPFYKYYENGIWSDMINIYSNFNPNLYLEAAVSDAGNNLHCIGYVSQLPVYLYYNFSTNEWFQPYPVGIQSDIFEYEDIAIDSQGNPFLVWHEQYFSVPGDNATVFRKKIGNTWGELELVKQSFDDLYMQNIEIVNDTPVIIESESTGDSTNMMLFRKDYTGTWYGDLVENYYRTEPWKVLHDNEYLYILMGRQEAYAEMLDIFITKAPLDIVTGSAEKQISSLNSNVLIGQNYPNPFNGTTQFFFNLTEKSIVSITIYDHTGKEISVINPGLLSPGNHSVEFNSASLPSGVYFYSLQLNGIKTDTKKMTLIK